MPVKKKTAIELPIEDVLQMSTQIESLSERKASKEKEVVKTVAVDNLRIQSIGQIQAVFDTLIREIDTIEDLKRKTREEIELEKRQSKQREEQENFTILLSERKRRAEFDEKLDKEKRIFEEEKAREEEKLKNREIALEAKTHEFDDLKMQVESFPIKLGKAVDDAKKQTSVELKRDFENEKAMLIQKYSSETKLLEQQIAGLQNQNKQQEKEIIYLKAEKTKAIEQINSLAITVIKGREKEQESIPTKVL